MNAHPDFLFYHYTVYWHPRDHPTHCVVRRWAIQQYREPIGDPEPWAVVDSLEEARLAIPQGLYCMCRHDCGDPQIVETWF